MRFLSTILFKIAMTAGLIGFSNGAWAQTLATRAPADNSSREFVMSCTYGVLAGTLVGAASLAFTKRPGDNLNRVARGASLGLYTGILLGLYVVYVVPGMDTQEEEDPLVGLNRRLDQMPLLVGPTITDGVVDGVQAQWNLLRF